MIQKKKVRLSDIADRLNISTVTVSKALADKEGVGDDLRQEIKDLAAEMGYKIKKNSITHSSSTTGNIGIIIPNGYFLAESSYYWFLFNHLTKALLKRNFYAILELISPEDEANLSIPHLLQDKKVDGLIMLGETSTAYIENIEKYTKNFVLLDFYTNNTNLDSVCDDNFFCTYILTNQIIAMGHKKLAFVGNFNSTTSIKDRFMGFQKAMLEHNLPCELSSIIPDREDGDTIIKINLPDNLNGITCFVCNCDETAAALIARLTEKGIKVPEDVSVTGFDDFYFFNKSSIPLATVYINPEDTADIASELIVKKVTGQPYIKGRHVVTGTVMIRDSLKKLN
ncbi:MAG: LacI family DNA-binding transcriptional regulator [Treponema sp.]|nr:LacI family DNA-binding transcriptional regulator [Treponema sp.]